MPRSITRCCPLCPVPLAPVELLPDLRSWRCGKCQGQWISGEHYRVWRERQPAGDGLPASPAGGAVEVHDSPAAKLCLDCGRLMGRQRAAAELAFSIDRCNTCGGIWLDANEWDALRAHDLENKIHLIFSTAWQAKLKRDDQHRQTIERLGRKLGEADLAELLRVKTWIDKHPLRVEIRAFLIDEE